MDVKPCCKLLMESFRCGDGSVGFVLFWEALLPDGEDLLMDNDAFLDGGAER
jgi:hypothetical protein